MNSAIRYTALGIAVAVLAHAQATPPKQNPADYPSHANLERGFEIAAEYLVHAIPTAQGSLFTDDYLVVETAFFGLFKDTLTISAEQFALRINGQRVPLMAQAPGMVAASMKYPDWTQRPRTVGSVGMGGPAVIFGQPRPVERFPGDPSARTGPTAPRAPEPADPSGQEKEAPMPIEEQIRLAALPEGVQVPPTAGLLFFPFKGKTKSIRSIELLYDGPAGKVTLKLL